MPTFHLQYSQPRLSAPDHNCLIWENKTHTFQLEEGASDNDARTFAREFLSQSAVTFRDKVFTRHLIRLQETPPRRTLWEHQGSRFSPDMQEVADKFFATPVDPNWPRTPLQERMQSGDI